jgi:Na+/citrate or Na+/malate symporter
MCPVVGFYVYSGVLSDLIQGVGWLVGWLVGLRDNHTVTYYIKLPIILQCRGNGVCHTSIFWSHERNFYRTPIQSQNNMFSLLFMHGSLLGDMED